MATEASFGLERVKALCDTNIVIDLLGGVQKASRELRKYDELFLSRMSWMEVLIGSPDQGTETLWLNWLRNFSILEIDAVVAAEAVRLRKLHRINCRTRSYGRPREAKL